MKISMFTSWQVRCGIADYAGELMPALNAQADTRVEVVAFDRQAHPRSDYVRWGQALNAGDLAHVQHEYSFFGYLLPWRNHFPAFARQIQRPLVITRHVSFDGPLTLAGRGWRGALHQFKWALYNRWLGPYARYLNRGLFDQARHVIVLSEHLKGHLTARGYPADKVSVIPPGMPTAVPASGGAALRAAWGWQNKTVLGVFGFIAAAKGHSLALEALARLDGGYALLIAGGVRRPEDEPLLAALERRIDQLGLRGRVRVTGYLPADAVPPHLSACDQLVYPYTRVDTSYSLNVGLAYQAAPVLASDVAAHRELAERSQAVALFPSGDAAALAQAITALAGDTTRRASLMENARRYAATHDWAAVARQTRAVYARVLAEAGGARPA